MKTTYIETAKIVQDMLASAGYKTLAVGGYVRDNLIGRECNDIDFATVAKPDQVIEVFEKLGCNVIPTGLKHGTVTVIHSQYTFEITTLRKDVECNGRSAVVEYTDSFEEDAKRRDLTINGLYMDLLTNEVTDYVGGVDDIENKTIKLIGNPVSRLREDNLRILRLIRFQAQLGFTIDGNSYDAALDARRFLHYISLERIRMELFKMIVGDYVDSLFYHHAFIDVILPELKQLRSQEQNCAGWHDYNVYEHTAIGVIHLKQYKDPILSFAHLLHDVAKPYCWSQDPDGTDHFYDHDVEGARVASNICNRLKLSAKDTKRIKFIIANHMKLHQINTDKGYRRIVAKCGEASIDVQDLIKINDADNAGQNSEMVRKHPRDVRGGIARALEYIPQTTESLSPLDGHEIIAYLGSSVDGKIIGTIKDKLHELVICGALRKHDKIGAYIVVDRELGNDTGTDNS